MALPRTVDPLEAYSNLATSVPEWIAELRSLRTHVAMKNAEFAAEYKRLLANAKPRRKKSPSLRSLRSMDDDSLSHLPALDATSAASLPASPADPVEISPFEAGNKYLYAQVRRKRKPGSSIRSGASGPQRFRTKQMVVIYYDSDVQNQLESTVKALGAARNELRKARQANSLNRGLQLPRLTRRSELSPPLGYRENPLLQRLSKGISPSPPTEKPTKPPVEMTATSTTAIDAHADSTFLSLDKDLENVQNLCETAAHQFLRDGDCKVELDNSLEYLNSAVEAAKAVMVQLQSEKKQADEAKARQAAIEFESQPAHHNHDDTHGSGREPTDSDSTLCETLSSPNSTGGRLKGLALTGLADDLTLGRHPDPAAPEGLGLGTMEIEVDSDNEDDDDEMEEVRFDYKQFRMFRAAGGIGMARRIGT